MSISSTKTQIHGNQNNYQSHNTLRTIDTYILKTHNTKPQKYKYSLFECIKQPTYIDSLYLHLNRTYVCIDYISTSIHHKIFFFTNHLGTTFTKQLKQRQHKLKKKKKRNPFRRVASFLGGGSESMVVVVFHVLLQPTLYLQLMLEFAQHSRERVFNWKMKKL